MKKGILCLSIVISCSSLVYSQIGVTERQKFYEIKDVVEFNKNSDNVQSSKLNVYLNEKWTPGVIYRKDSVLIQGLTYRYNVYSDKIELKSVVNPSGADFVSIGTIKFTYSEYYNEDSVLDKGYFELISNGKCKLLLRREIDYKEAMNKDSSYGMDASTTIAKKLFLKMGDDPAIEVEKSKDFLMSFLSDKEDVTEFINKKLIIILTKKKLKEIIDYYNSI